MSMALPRPACSMHSRSPTRFLSLLHAGCRMLLDDAARLLTMIALEQGILASICTVAGRACIALDRNAQAIFWLSTALHYDPDAYEALQILNERSLIDVTKRMLERVSCSSCSSTQ